MHLKALGSGPRVTRAGCVECPALVCPLQPLLLFRSLSAQQQDGGQSHWRPTPAASAPGAPSQPSLTVPVGWRLAASAPASMWPSRLSPAPLPSALKSALGCPCPPPELSQPRPRLTPVPCWQTPRCAQRCYISSEHASP